MAPRWLFLVREGRVRREGRARCAAAEGEQNRMRGIAKTEARNVPIKKRFMRKITHFIF
ncbi:hypothetical protein [Parahaliea mediterranea]|uniref:Uncharacterized protein n=1 Tax=Parahaliea mediterranea TaxID=651086 RepID=A0A939ILS4_9GAMM|nr:hypothetical protein [Parahaliea mediterranea]MBN7798691.1 hypothetical protein [Parahaliea mediterranea]